MSGEDPLEKEIAAHSSILAWRIPWTEEPGGLQTMGSQESNMTERLSMRERAPGINPTHEKESVLQITELPDHELTLLWELLK